MLWRTVPACSQSYGQARAPCAYATGARAAEAQTVETRTTGARTAEAHAIEARDIGHVPLRLAAA
ncbi:hypothetical protein [Streptomyces sp. NPDC059788]|uniref:hypothetical protein n=1 Tax=Streptomyces sp. NPDC059788 TaxID=3346948 RepID=UPI003667C925